MMNNTSDIDTAKAWYIRLLKEQFDIEPQYNRIREQRESIRNQISGLEQVLWAAKVDIEALKSTVKLVEEADNETAEVVNLPDIITQVLKASGKPMHYKDITAEIIDRGLDIPGRDRANTVLAYITRDKRVFVKAPEVRRGYYKLKE